MKTGFLAIPIAVLISLLFYFGTLAATQTVYGIPFMALRWVALGTLTVVSFVYWLFGRMPRKGRNESWGGPSIVFLYLGATLLSVPMAENYRFSGLRWGTQGMLILSCMVFLRGTFNPEKIKDLTLPLKILSVILLLISLWFPTDLPDYESPYFRGAMGDSNSLGHVSAICTLVFFFGAFTARKKGWKALQAAIALLSFVILIRSGARSSMLAFWMGFFLINFFFGFTRSLLVKAGAFLCAALIIASPMLQTKAVDFLSKEEKKKENSSFISAMKNYSKTGRWSGSVFATRERLWADSWEGFSKRPLLGWGFGANADIPKEWSVSPTGTTVSRDVTNDPLFILEGCGVVGFAGYLLLILSILKQTPTPWESFILRKRFRKELPSIPGTNIPGKTVSGNKSLRGGSDQPRTDGTNGLLDDLAVSRAHVHAQMYILSVSLFVLFFFDGSAFSAGSLISAIFWASTGMASLMRVEAIASERARDQGLENSFKGLKWARNRIGR